MKNLLFMLIPLVFFGAGMLFASLLWGKYKRLSIALRAKADQLEEEEMKLQTSFDELLAKHTDQSTTCRTLEEELAYIATERESLMAELVEARAERTRLKDLEAEHASISERCLAQEERTAALRKVFDQTQTDAMIAAENRAKQSAAEKEQVLALVAKLQEKLDTFGPVRKQLLEEQQAAQLLVRSVRFEQIRRRRSIREQQDSVGPRRGQTKSRVARHRRPVPIASGIADISTDTDAAPAAHASDNGNSRPGVAKRMLARLIPSTSTSARAKAETPQRTSRHW